MRRAFPPTTLFRTLSLAAAAAVWCVSAHAQVAVDGTPSYFSGTGSSLAASVAPANAGGNGVLLVGVSLTESSDGGYVTGVT